MYPLLPSDPLRRHGCLGGAVALEALGPQSPPSPSSHQAPPKFRRPPQLRRGRPLSARREALWGETSRKTESSAPPGLPAASLPAGPPRQAPASGRAGGARGSPGAGALPGGAAGRALRQRGLPRPLPPPRPAPAPRGCQGGRSPQPPALPGRGRPATGEQPAGAAAKVPEFCPAGRPRREARAR